MKVVRDNLWLCTDCTLYAANGDLTGIDSDKRVKEVEKGVDRLGPHLVANFDDHEGTDEFSWRPCAACRSKLGGARTRFAILGE